MKHLDHTDRFIRHVQAKRWLETICLDAIDAGEVKDTDSQVSGILEWLASQNILPEVEMNRVSVPLVRDYLLGIHK